MKEFHINQYLSVRLERGKTVIYVAGQPFIQCKFLLLNIPITQMSSFDEIESIDEVADLVDGVLEEETRKIEIPPEVEFWGHSSNLQVWYEHDYDTRLIHSNLAFPLLQKLSEVGDPLAKEKFQEEVRKRYEKGTEKTREFIRKAGIIDYLPLDEQFDLYFDSEILMALTEFAEEYWSHRKPYDVIMSFIIEGNLILKEKKKIELDFSGVDLELYEFPKAILNLKSLEALDLGNNYFKETPEEINKLTSLKRLSFSGNKISHLPDTIWEITSLEELHLSSNHIETISEKIGNLQNLEVLNIVCNQLQDLPESIGKLKKLKKLYIGGNKIEKLPDYIESLPSLKYLEVVGCPLSEDPEEIKKMVELNKKTSYSLRIRRR
ncbi:MAG: leucine-rich repeat domain-containing protein [Promethearchaeota archaeon]